MAQSRPAHVSGASLSRFDLSDEENVKQAEFELRCCASDFDFGRWARNWGDAAVKALRDGPSRDDIEANETYQEVEKALSAISTAVNKAVAALDPISEREDIPDALSNELGAIVSALEDAVREAQ